jgi:hypothetical protein
MSGIGMKTFNNSREVNDAGYAFPCYDISRVIRTWRYNGKIFTTLFDVPVERVMWKSYELEVLPMDQIDASI